jgi:hypothetical protein
MSADKPVEHHWTTHIGQAAGHPAAFLFVIVYAVLWLIFSPGHIRVERRGDTGSFRESQPS